MDGIRAGATLRVVIFLWACFVVRGLFYCVSLPVWEGFDEPAHFGYVQRVAVAGAWLVRPDTSSTREVESSISLLPMPWVLRNEPLVRETHESYWRLPAAQRRDREQQLAALPRSLGALDSLTALPVEAPQPPLAYWLMAPVYKLFAGSPLVTRVLVLRLVNLLLASIAVPAAWCAARYLFGATTEAEAHGGDAGRVAIAVAAVVALVPEVMFDSARVANSGLSIALFSALAVLLLAIAEERTGVALWAGLVLGLGLLTKAFFLTAVPAVVALLVWAVWKGRLRLRSAAASLGIAAAISGWWYVRNLSITGSFSGLLQDAALRNTPISQRLQRAAEVDWLVALDSTFFSHIWFGSWSFLQVRSWIYRFFAVLAVLALIGLAVAWARSCPPRRRLAALSALYALFCAGLAYHILITFLVNGISSSAGWYLCAVIVPEAILAVVGLRALAPQRARPYVAGGVAAAFALLDLYGAMFVAVPYYTGLIGHKANGLLESFHLSRLNEIGLGEVLRRLATNKPAFVGPGVVAAVWFAYLAATAALVFVALRAEARAAATGPVDRGN